VATHTAVDTGQGSACGLRGGELYCWGRNSSNQWDVDGAPLQIREPVRVGTAGDWASVQTGQDSTCAINAASELYCSGYNAFANLGTGDRDSRTVLSQIAPGTLFRSVSIDTFHGCAVGVDGGLHCWGRAIEGQLGFGDLVEREAPELVSPGPYKQVAVGRFFSCVVSEDDELFCTGADDSGQLGLGDTERRNVFERVTF
jgi:alpha-tubulin suppressor-like RCC1 family protein